MSEYSILLVESDISVKKRVTAVLEEHQYGCITASTGEEAVRKVASVEPDFVLLNSALPDLDGIEVIRQIRSWSNVPIIFLSRECEMYDRINALNTGADDCITLPLSVEELLAKLWAMKRRIYYIENRIMSQPVFVNGRLRIVYPSGCAFLNDQELHLTPIEYKLLCLLAKNVGKVLTHKYITENVWGNSWKNDVVSLRVFMTALRKKLETSPGSPAYIQTQVGVGYRMVPVESI